MTYQQCPYKNQCVRYQNEALSCTWLYNFCIYKRRIDRVEERQKVKDLAEKLAIKTI